MPTNTYEISYVDLDATTKKHKRVTVGQIAARNGIAAIKDLLVARLDGNAELLAELDDVRTLGSNKRLYFAGITFEANKVRA